MVKTYQFKTHCKDGSHSSKTANIILPGLMIKQSWTPLRVQTKWYSNSTANETTHLTEFEYYTCILLLFLASFAGHTHIYILWSNHKGSSLEEEPLWFAGARFLQARCSYCYPINSSNPLKEEVLIEMFHYTDVYAYHNTVIISLDDLRRRRYCDHSVMITVTEYYLSTPST